MPTDHIFCVLQVLREKTAYSEAGRLFVDVNKPMKSVRREVVYNIHMYFLETGKANKNVSA